MTKKETKIKKAAQLLLEADFAVSLTGAGVSVESGIPDFRSPGGLWSKYSPSEYATTYAFRDHPEKFWKMAWEVLPLLKSALPNPAHISLAKLEENGYLKAVITQNIDGLHQRAGSQNTIEVFGGYKSISCLRCRKVFSLHEVTSLYKPPFPPKCSKCSSILKPDIILFGEPLNQKVLGEATELVKKSDLLLIIGTSFSVYPINIFPKIALKKGAKLIIIDRNNFNFFSSALHIQGKAGEILPELIKHLNYLVK